MSFNSYFLNFYTQMGLITLLLVSCFAWWKGGIPERLGTLILCISAFSDDFARAFTGELTPTTMLFLSDAILSTGFLYIAIRYSSLWLGAAMMFQGLAFAFHAMQMIDGDAPRWHGMILYLLVHNILSYLLMASLAAGTVATILKRRANAREKALSEARMARRLARLTPPPTPLANMP
jgi:Flp pilus assembly protein protease CpaA